MVEAKEPPFDNPKVTSGWRCDEGGSEQFFAFTTKYSQQIADQTQPRTDANYPFLRYADVVLIFAEAANELANVLRLRLKEASRKGINSRKV